MQLLILKNLRFFHRSDKIFLFLCFLVLLNNASFFVRSQNVCMSQRQWYGQFNGDSVLKKKDRKFNLFHWIQKNRNIFFSVKVQIMNTFDCRISELQKAVKSSRIQYTKGWTQLCVSWSSFPRQHLDHIWLIDYSLSMPICKQKTIFYCFVLFKWIKYQRGPILYLTFLRVSLRILWLTPSKPVSLSHSVL